MGNTCTEFRKEIEQHFPFLFRERGFTVSHVLESSRHRCLIVLASDKFRIKLYKTLDEINILLGGPTATASWEVTIEGRQEWYYLYSIAGFLSNDLDLKIADRVRGKGPQDRTHEKQLAVLAELLEQHFDAIDKLFGSDGLQRVMPAYERYLGLVEERLETRIGGAGEGTG